MRIIRANCGTLTIPALLLICLSNATLAAKENNTASSWFSECYEAATKQDPGKNGNPAYSIPDWGKTPFTLAAWICTTQDGVIASKQGPKPAWAPQNKALFIRDGHACFDIGWVGCIESYRPVSDGKWHHLALACDRNKQTIYIDGAPAVNGTMGMEADPPGTILKIGRGADNFPLKPAFKGKIEEVRIYHKAMSADEIKAEMNSAAPIQDGLAFHAALHSEQDPMLAANYVKGRISFDEGRTGKSLSLNGDTYLAFPSGPVDPMDKIWSDLSKRHTDDQSQHEMNMEKEDCIWMNSRTPADLAGKYAAAAGKHWPGIAETAARTNSGSANDINAVEAARKVYLKARMFEEGMQKCAAENLDTLRSSIQTLAQRFGNKYRPEPFISRLDKLTQQKEAWAKSTEAPEGVDKWLKDIATLRFDAIVRSSPGIDFDKLVFVKRLTYNSNHYYTEYINGSWLPGGNICILDLKTGSVKEVVPQLKDGTFERFDLSFDATKIVFAWKASAQVGYRIYEINVDGSGLRQLTFPQADEADLEKKYRVASHYHHATDDMQPCYLPDGGIAFISTRCQFGILCDGPDDFTTTVLYRMDASGGNMQRLSNSSVSEASPVMLADGRIMYTRWEYVDKGAVSVKCLWAMKPDGTASSEIYGNDISLPPTLIYGRPIPNAANKYVVLGTPHCPQNGMGTVIRLDMSKNIRTRDPMTYMTEDVDIQAEPGFAFKMPDGQWHNDSEGKGRLFKDPYPLSENLFMVSHKPAGPRWSDSKAYGLYLLDDKGAVTPVYSDPEISCWLPYPLKARQKPPVLVSMKDPNLAATNQAVCVVSDVYRGLLDVKRGSIKYIRVLEQIPRPWAARRRWTGDCYDQQHATVTKDTHLGLKVQHGIVPVEEDGSACFVVPAMANIFVQILDENYMAVQTERTFVDYMPGEVRSCVGCHETPANVGRADDSALVKQALSRKPSIPGPQPGEKEGKRSLDYVHDVQPVWDAHCIKCHSGDAPKGKLNLSGSLTELFNVSYENLVPERRKGKDNFDRNLLGPVIGENHPKTGNVHYLPAKSLGSHTSVLVAMLSKGKVQLQDPVQKDRAAKLTETHKDINLSKEELLKVTNWIDTNAQFYGSYWGRKNLKYKGHPQFRPYPTFEEASSMTSPVPEDQR